ncbi:MAG: O-antigen ligase family protein [Polaromonas sp.]|uniref:O-antigen ligase family protein n=1 Tax=Polaromonas sp. TaxID=1869339 RepID=UPI00273051E3|nr:O-antigen ligase family protein [Polaromonas sp.]MDP2450419.1 O-antigen ligase family protein [Polaromonas sp.]MDP3247155.1 O-antigen ligase family protein [Polaromonas sp.]MDP3757057.1 O-antigen ligase family protein [Polaromonas sp.]
MTAFPIESNALILKNAGIRMALVCLVAASVGLSVAIISIGKVLLVVTLSLVLLRGNRAASSRAALQEILTPLLATIVALVFIVSLLWTSAPLNSALGAVGKYGKFLLIPALLVLVQTRREAAYALAFFLGAQFFLLLGSWGLYFHVPVPWATSNMATTAYAVFSSYLDQGIMSAVAAAVFWHLRSLAPNRFLLWVAILASVLALGCVFIVFTGRTGHLVGVAVLSLAIFFALPRKYRLASLLVPPLMLMVVFFSFDKVAQRFLVVKSEISSHSAKFDPQSSSGVRLNLWKTSVEAIVERPLMGSGVGSWVTEYNRIEKLKNPLHPSLGAQSHGNPHQEFLLWGVQLGVGGILLLFAFGGAVLLDLRKMEPPIARAGQSVLLALAVSCLFNSSLYDAYIGDFFCVSLGVLLAYGFHSREASRGGVAVGVVQYLKNEDRLIKT